MDMNEELDEFLANKDQFVDCLSKALEKAGFAPPSREFFDLTFKFIELQEKTINDPIFEGNKETGYEYLVATMFSKLSMDQKRLLIKELEE